MGRDWFDFAWRGFKTYGNPGLIHWGLMLYVTSKDWSDLDG